MPCVVASCAVANAPMAANVAWHSEICPAMPVITVIEQEDDREDRRLLGRRRPSSTLAWKKM